MAHLGFNCTKSDKAFRGTSVLTLPSLNGFLLEITLKVPLSLKYQKFAPSDYKDTEIIGN